VTLTPWSHGWCLSRDTTVPDTYTASHLDHIFIRTGDDINHAAASKRMRNATMIGTLAFEQTRCMKLGRTGIHLANGGWAGHLRQLITPERPNTFCRRLQALPNEGIPFATLCSAFLCLR